MEGDTTSVPIGKPEEAKEITEKGKDLTLFFEAVEKNELESVEKFLQSGFDVNARDGGHYNQTALHVAATKGHADMVHFLVENKADINIEDQLGEVALHRAVDNHHINIVKYLVNMKSDYSRDVADLMAAIK